MQVPGWFRQFTTTPRRPRFIEVDGARIHYDTWPGQKERPGLLFVHGNGAHSHWWDFIAPAFMDDFNVMAMDLSGAGDSGHRQRYSAGTFADEITAVLRDAGMERPIVAGHSFGGSMARITGYRYGETLGGLVLIDSGISGRRGRRQPPPRPRSVTRYYDTMSEAMKRFRLRPPQPCENTYLLDYIAEHSIEQTEHGYRYKLDQAMFAKMADSDDLDLPDAVTLIRKIKCPVGFIYGEQSRFFPPEAVALLKTVIVPDLLYSIPNAHHHVFLDQPLAFIDTLKQLLSRILN